MLEIRRFFGTQLRKFSIYVTLSVIFILRPQKLGLKYDIYIAIHSDREIYIKPLVTTPTRRK